MGDSEEHSDDLSVAPKMIKGDFDNPSRSTRFSEEMRKIYLENKLPVGIFASVVGVSIIILIAFITVSSIPPGRELQVSTDLEGVLISEDGLTSYVKLAPEVDKDKVIGATINFFDKKEKKYSYHTNKKTGEIKAPERKEVYDYSVSAADVLGLGDFNDIVMVGIDLEYEPGSQPDNSTNDTDSNNNGDDAGLIDDPADTSSSSSSSGGSGGGKKICSTGQWTFSYYYCNNSTGERIRVDTRAVCGSEASLQEDIDNCSAEEICYDGVGSDSDKCLNKSSLSNCIESDNGNDSLIFGQTILSVIGQEDTIRIDFCYYYNINLTEYYCNWNGSMFELKSQNYTCEDGCKGGACIVCADIPTTKLCSNGVDECSLKQYINGCSYWDCSSCPIVCPEIPAEQRCMDGITSCLLKQDTNGCNYWDCSSCPSGSDGYGSDAYSSSELHSLSIFSRIINWLKNLFR